MTISRVDSAYSSTTDAGFRAWTKQISDQLQAIGLVKTADSGQINFATVALPTSSNTMAGFEIFRFNDPLQATAPIFLKVEYGIGTGGSPQPAMRVIVGTASNGTGGITGVTTSSNSLNWINVTAGVSFPSFACFNADAGGFYLAAFVGSNASNGSYPNQLVAFGVFRTATEAGAVTGEGYAFYRQSSGNVLASVYNFATNTLVSAGSSAYTFVPSGLASTLVGTDVQTYRHWHSLPALRPTLGLVTYLSGELGKFATFTLPKPDGGTRTYLALDVGASGASITNAANHSLAMVWE